MYLTRLSLTNFRNYSRLSLDLPCGVVILQGANAQGKTNLLEAIYYLAVAKSPYAMSDSELVHWLAHQDDLPYARIVAELAQKEGSTRIEITLTQPANGRSGYRKHVRINGVPKRAMDLLGIANVVLFVPQDMSLIDGAPSGRRRYVDSLLCQIDASYCRSLTKFNRVLERRNHLLRRLRDRGGSRDQLEFWDQELARNGAQVIAARQKVVVDLERLAQPIHHDLSGGRERLRLRYVPSLDPCEQAAAPRQMSLGLDVAPPISSPQDPGSIQQTYLDALHSLQRDEIQRGLTLAGPHRDDLCFFDGQVDLRKYGSRGQQRTAVLALKLAEITLMAGVKGEKPILLLDEVMSELDADRRHYLCSQLRKVEQTIVTTTDLNALTMDVLEQATVYSVSQGHLDPSEGSERTIELNGSPSTSPTSNPRGAFLS